MTVSLWTVAAYGLQLAALVTVAFAMTWLLRLRVPRHALRFWQVVLAIAVLAPLAQSRGADAETLPVVIRSAATAMSTATSSDGWGIDRASLVVLIIAAGITAR